MIRLSLFLLIALSGGVAQAVEIQHWQTANGVPVYFVESRDLPMVDVRVVFDAGSVRDGNSPGLALLTNGLLVEGAGELDADAIATGFDRLGVRLSHGADQEMAWMQLRALSEADYLRPASELMSQLLTRPSFPASSLERDRANMLLALQAEAQSPEAVANRAYQKALYGSHPYGSLPSGTTESITDIRREQIIAFHQRYYVAAGALVAIVGDLDRQGAATLADRLVGALPKGQAPTAIESVKPLERAVEKHLPHPSSQTHIRIGQPGMSRLDPDYFPLYVGNHILGGGGLVSRLFRTIREERGLAYSVYSYFSPMRGLGPFTLGMQTKGEQAGEAVALLRQELEAFVAAGPDEAELERSKQNILGGFALRLDSNSKILNYLAVIGFYDLPLDYLDRFSQRVAAVTRADVQQAFARRIKPDRLVTLTVGGSDSD
ncbi:MAG: insulinase family protein [Gammaproteobacteria bacterium]|nr:insulinase family protein [Gammaproteobacteria bacterium]